MPDETATPAAPEGPRDARGRAGRWLLAFACLLLVVCLGVAGAAAWLMRALDTPFSTAKDPAQVVVEVAPGQSVWGIARTLEAAGLLRDARLFVLLARLERADTGLRAGRYRVHAGLSPRELLDRLHRGEVVQIQVTLPEGLTRFEIAETLAARGLAERDAFLAVTEDTALLAEYGIDARDAEGYLFPDTYRFAEGLPAEAIARAMLARFREVFDEAIGTIPPERGLDRHELVTLASIVEKESSLGDEQPIVAGVFANRLERGMRLETDPTVIYGLLPDFDGNLTREHLRTPTPYNTYVIPGLPPGPISNPGRGALEAVAEPADVPYLFFVSRNDGTHVFSTTYAEHEANVYEYQIRRGRSG